MGTRLNKSELWQMPNHLTNRIKGTIDFIELTGAEIIGKVADCGENNPMKEAIEKHFGIKIDSIDLNFNYEMYHFGTYDTILCFEVLEHVMNPLLFLDQLTNKLNKGGVIYLSTPYQYPQCLKAKHHYHEIPTDRLMWLFEEAGLKIEEKGKITIAGNWYNHMSGIRKALRYFQKTRIYKLSFQ